MKSIAARFSSRETILPGRVFRSVARLLLICFFVAFLVTGAWGAIPASERTTLLNLYTFTNGDSWTNNTNWNGDVGTECSWWGVTCDYDSNHVVQIQLGQNNLIGTLPDLSGLTNLDTFYVDNNQLTGSIPSLSGLTNLQAFRVGGNQLTGPIPSLSGLTNLQAFKVAGNLLTGDVPAVPSPDSLVSGGSYLCPNYLNPTIDPAWDAATGSTPWYQNCTAAPAPYSVYYSDNGSTGGSVPVDSSTYFPAQMVTVLGNTGALYETGNSFAGWNTAANGSGTPYVGGDTFAMGGANVALYAQWTTASGSPVRIAETLVGYPDIRSAYEAALNGQTIEAQDGLGSSQNPLLFDNPNDYNPFSVKLIGGFNSSSPHFTTDTGATLVIGGIEISRGSIEIGNIIIQ